MLLFQPSRLSATRHSLTTSQGKFTNPPLHHVVTCHALKGAGGVANYAKRDHADHDSRIADHRIRRVDHITQPELAGHHYPCHQREPGNTDRYLQACNMNGMAPGTITSLKVCHLLAPRQAAARL